MGTGPLAQLGGDVGTVRGQAEAGAGESTFLAADATPATKDAVGDAAAATGRAGSRRPAGGGSERPDKSPASRLPRVALRTGILAAICLAASGPILQLAALIGADDWGSDWRWLADGLGRLAAGLPLNHPEYVAGPFSQLANGPAYTWSLHPPWNATLVAPLLLLPADLRQATWAVAMAAVVIGTVWLAWPRGLWWGTNLLLAVVALGPPLLGPSVGLVDQVHFANPDALVLLGTVLVWRGRFAVLDALDTASAAPRAPDPGRPRRWPATAPFGTLLMAAGLVLAAVKIVPAISLAAWLLATRTGRRSAASSIAVAGVALLALTLPVIALDPGVIGDTIAVQLNLIPWPGDQNLAPQVRLAPILGTVAATWLSRLAGVGLIGLVVVRRLDGRGGFILASIAPLLLTPQLWAHWFLIPIAAALVAADAWGPLRTVDRRLRRWDADVRGTATAVTT